VHIVIEEIIKTMSRAIQTSTTNKVEFLVSAPLDMMNAMYFTHLVRDSDGIDGWPAQVRNEMDPALLEELDFMFTFPRGQPGVMGMLTDALFSHPETRRDVDALMRFVREMPAGVGDPPLRAGIQGLTLYGVCSPFPEVEVNESLPPRERLVEALEASGRDVQTAMALFDRPEEIRERLLSLIRRFYEEHYREELPRRLSCLERSAATHRKEPTDDMPAMIRRLAKREEACITQKPSEYTEFLFAPSLDMGPYMSCSDMAPIHGLFYPCEPDFMSEESEEAEEAQQMARIYKALGDEQRLRILNMLRGREMYAQEVVERTGLHQSVVSRHLSFMTAVGLLSKRREGNMKFFSLNPGMQEKLEMTIALFRAADPAAGV
jgi:DNA-binding transcriptional ArsR family regulator